MAGRSDIQAGKATITLGINNSAFVKALRNSSAKLKDFGKATAVVGAGFTAAGAAILAPLGAMVNELLAVGDAFDKMRQRTGLSAEAISELDHAASQSGTNLETVEGAIAKMQKGLAAGSKGFEKLGLSVKSLKAMTPEEQFEAVAAKLAKIQDPSKRAAAAMEVFGKSGTQLLPMIEDLDTLRQEARDMGFVMSGETAAGAVKLGDMMANLAKTVKWAGLAVADILIPPLTTGVAVVQKIVSVVADWVKENRGLVLTIAAVGAALLAAGAAITTIGIAIAGAGVALGGIATAIAAVGSVLGVILSPIGLITAALVAGAVVWAKYTESGQAAISGIMGFLGPLLETFKTTFAGIADAVMSGDLALAGQIAMAGLRVAFLQGIAALASAVGGAFGDFIGAIGQQLIAGDFSGVWATMVDGMWAVWSQFTEGIIAAFTAAADFIINKWRDATSFISRSILSLAKKFPSIGKIILGVDPASFDLKQAQDFATQDIGRKAEGAKAGLNLAGLNTDAQARTRAAAEQLGRRTAGGAGLAGAASAAAQADLDRLTAEASRLREEQRAKEEERKGQVADVGAAADIGGLSSKVAGSFSAAALMAMGGQSPMERAARAAEEQAKETKELRKETIRMRNAVEAGGMFA